MDIHRPVLFDQESLLTLIFNRNTLSAILPLFIILYVKYFLRRSDPDEKFSVTSLPGPKPFPLKVIGNCLSLLREESVLPTMVKWSAKYGPCYRVTISNDHLVWLNSAENVEAVLKSLDLDHIPKPDSIYGHLKMFMKNSLLMSEGQFWKSKRKLLTRGHSFNSLKSYLPMLHRHSSRILTALEKVAETQNAVAAPIDELLSVLFFDVITELVTGADLYNSKEGERCRHWLKKGDEIMILRITKPWLQFNAIWWFHPDYKTLEQSRFHLKDFALKLLGDYRKRNVKGNVEEENGFRSMLQEVCDDGWSDEEIVGDVLLMLAAGHETSASSLGSLLFLLALNHKCQDLCHQEIDSVLGSCDTTRPITMDDLSNLKYLEWCLLEAMRIFPPFYLYARKLGVPVKLKDMSLPTGITVAISPWTQHRLEQYWPEPEKFDPNRFSPDEVAKRPAYAYIPFSRGIRNCLGMKLAIMEIKLNAAQILHKFRFTTGTKQSDVTMLPRLLATPKTPCKFVIHKRFPNVNEN